MFQKLQPNNYFFILFFISLLFSCGYNNNQKVNLPDQSTSIAIDTIAESKNLFSEFLNKRRDENLNEVSIYNLDTINGFRNLKLEINLDSLKKELNFSELNEHYYSTYSDKLKVLYLNSEVDFGTAERKNLVETKITLFFWKNLLNKIIISYDCSTMFRDMCNPPGWLDSTLKVFGKYQKKEKTECEELTEEEYRRRSENNIFESEGFEISKEINCTHIYTWKARKAKLILLYKLGQKENTLLDNNNTNRYLKNNNTYSFYEMSMNISLLDKEDIINAEIKNIERLIKERNKLYKIERDSLNKDNEFKSNELVF